MSVSLRKRTARLGLLFVVGMLLLQQHIALGCLNCGWGGDNGAGDDKGAGFWGEGGEDGDGGRDNNGQRVLP